MRKFKARYVVVPILIAAIVGGSVFGVVQKRKADSFIKVVNVGEIEFKWGFWGEDPYYGTLKKGSVANYTAEEELEIDRIFVKKGDTVSKGDVLYTYDTKSLQLNVETAENEVKTIENKITVSTNELDILKKLQPSENAPKDNPSDDEPNDEPEFETPDIPSMENIFSPVTRVSANTKPISGSGSQDDPYIFFTLESTVFTKEYLQAAAESRQSVYILAYVCTPSGDVQYGRLIDSSKIDKTNISDWVCSDGISIDAMGGISANDNLGFAKVIVYPHSFNVMNIGSSAIIDDAVNMDDFYEMPEEDFNIDDISNSAHVNEEGISANDATYEISYKDNYMYSREELKTLISDKEKEIERLKLDKKQADINLKKAKSKLDTGAELATISGTVTFIAEDINHLSENGYFATITSSNGMSVSASIGEFSLSEIAVGDPVTIEDYNTGNIYSGTITYIGDKPMEDNDFGGGESATESMYEFIVSSEDDLTLDEDSGVAINLDNEPNDNVISLEVPYVREENGRFYAMVQNSEGVLEKRMLETKGGVMYGYVVQITGGLTSDDYIALPYGKAVEGMPTVQVTQDEMYGILGIF